MADQIMCPICGKHPLKVGVKANDAKKTPNRVYCEGYKFDPASGGNIGECDFTFWLGDSKKGSFGKDLSPADAKKLFNGETIISPLKHKMTFDKDAPTKGYKKIEWAEKIPDAYL